MQRAPERRSVARRELAARRRRKRLLTAMAGVTALAGLGIGIGSIVAFGGGAVSNAALPVLSVGPLGVLGQLQSPPPQGLIGPEGIPVPGAAPLLADTAAGATGAAVDGISCDRSEQVAYHIHVHLTVFAGGLQRRIPGGIGVPNPQVQTTPEGAFVASGSCFYWLHTHAADGIIHVESPTQRTYTLGQFFDLWGQPLSRTRVAGSVGTVVAFYNGKHYLADPRDIPLTAHANVQLDVGSPLVGPVTLSSWGQL